MFVFVGIHLDNMQDFSIPTLNVTNVMDTSASIIHVPCVMSLAALRTLVLVASLPTSLRGERCNHHDPHNRNAHLCLPKPCTPDSHA